MSDTRDRLAEILHKQGAYCGTCDYESRDCPDCTKVLEGYADAILAEFLVIPRTEITTEYGVRIVGEDGSHEFQVDDLARATHLVKAKRKAGLTRGFTAELLSHPVLPWSPIPLPEDGQPCETCGGTGTVACWSPGGPCRTSPCEACGPCTSCKAGES